MERKYYEVEFGNWEDLSDLYSICIVGTRKPSLKEATEFCDRDFEIVLFNGKEIRVHTLGELLPYVFDKEQLK